MLSHVGNVDISFCDVRDHPVDGLLVLFFLEIGRKVGALAVAGRQRGYGAVADLSLDLGDGDLGGLQFPLGCQPQSLFLGIFDQVIVIEDKLGVRNLEFFGVTGGDVFKLTSIVVGQIAYGPRDQRQTGGIFFPVFLQVTAHYALETFILWNPVLITDAVLLCDGQVGI